MTMSVVGDNGSVMHVHQWVWKDGNILFEVKDCVRVVAVTVCIICFFFKAEDGIRDVAVTGVQTCALPISDAPAVHGRRVLTVGLPVIAAVFVLLTVPFLNQPVDSWEWLNRSAARSIVVSGIPALGVAPGAGAGPQSLVLFHPPSSAYLAALSLWLLGDGEWQARLAGGGVGVLTRIGLALLVRRGLGRGPAAAGAGESAAAGFRSPGR